MARHSHTKLAEFLDDDEYDDDDGEENAARKLRSFSVSSRLGWRVRSRLQRS